MTPNAFIISKLQSFINDFPQTRVRYEHDKLSNIHFVEVVPNEVYHLNDKYIEWESNMFDEFIEQFPQENIGFISDDALVGIKQVDFELKGIYFEIPYSFDIKSTIVETKCIEISSFVNLSGYQYVTVSRDIRFITGTSKTRGNSKNEQIDILAIAS